ncbi:outer membrane beta-barrel protein [Ferriphaselus sp. R-1]|uniref:outer membrane beta-barrel protein n=1 Tax=Ferriphaselus sp. R-1 TaxID=1485544 RepID=UPI0009DF4E84|nr:outer membrane beta-barrel protein [Ferriphaselus sp. R-1]
MKKSVIGCLVISALSAMSAAHAVEVKRSVGGYAPVTQWDPAGIKAEPFVITPWLGVAYGRDSNVGLSNTLPQSSSLVVVNPNLAVVAEGAMQRYSAYYTGNWARYSSSSRDNFNDNMLGAEAENEWTGRLNTRIKADYVSGHDPRNAFRLGAAPEHWQMPSAQGAVHYGAPEATGQLEFEVGMASKRYTTNRLLTVAYDRDTRDMAGKFLYKVGVATHVNFKVAERRNVYQNFISAGRNSTEQKVQVGLSWDATSQTSGSMMVGSMSKKFDSGLVSKGRGLSWDVDMQWKPLTYSSIAISGGRNFTETMDVGNFIIVRDMGVSWNHDWAHGVETALTYQNATDTFSGIYRVDQRSNVGAKVSYAMRRWLRGGVELQRQNRNSTDALYTYSRNIVLFSIEGSL